MKTCTKCGETKPLFDFPSDNSKKDGKHLNCTQCRAVGKRAYYLANKERQKQWHADWVATNIEARREHARKYVRKHKAKVLVTTRAYQLSKRNASPAWADKHIIAFLYATRQYMTEQTGVEWHVDHVVPITSDIVCGLHVHFNLRIIPSADNIRKGNKFSTD